MDGTSLGWTMTYGTFEVYIRYQSFQMRAGEMGDYFAAFHIHHFKPARRKPGHSPARQDWLQIREQRLRHCYDQGTEDVPYYLFRIEMSQQHFSPF
jgi:hypothetical protein